MPAPLAEVCNNPITFAMPININIRCERENKKVRVIISGKKRN